MPKGKLVVLSGFSGAGKGTIVQEVLQRNDNYVVSVSATTRAPRSGEEHGVHYFFVEEADFLAMIARGELLEYAQYREQYYGTPAPFVREMMEAGKTVILEIEVQGAAQIKEMMPEAILVFVSPPSLADLQSRLRARGTEEDAEIEKRLLRAVEEAAYIDDYDYLLINDDLETAVDDFCAIVQAAGFERTRSRETIQKLQSELRAYKEGGKKI